MRALLFLSSTRKLLTTIAIVLVATTSVLAQDANPDDIVSPLAIVEATYESIIRAPGENFDWDRFRSLFIPDAVLIPNTEQRSGEFSPMSTEGFIEWIDGVTTVGGENDQGFAEETIFNEVRQYGDIANVVSTYQKRFYTSDQILGRGINHFQLVNNGGRWWIVSIVWDEENGAGPIPDQFLSE